MASGEGEFNVTKKTTTENCGGNPTAVGKWISPDNQHEWSVSGDGDLTQAS